MSDEGGKELRRTKLKCSNCGHLNEIVQNPDLDDMKTPPGSVMPKRCASCRAVIMQATIPPKGLSDEEAARWAQDQFEKTRR